MNLVLKRLIFYWGLSYVFAIIGFAFFGLFDLSENVFPFGYYFLRYNPFAYIFIPCFVYGVLAASTLDRFYNSKIVGRIFWYFLILLGVVLIGSILGGVLSGYDEMKMGYISDNQFMQVIGAGFLKGPKLGLFIVFVCYPYNLLAVIIGYFIFHFGALLFHNKDKAIRLKNMKEELPHILDDSLD